MFCCESCACTTATHIGQWAKAQIDSTNNDSLQGPKKSWRFFVVKKNTHILEKNQKKKVSTIFTFPRLFFCHNFRKKIPKKKPCESPSPSKRYVFFSATQGGSSARSDWFTHSLSKASSRRGCLSRKTVRVAKLRLWPSFCGCLWQLLFQKSCWREKM